MDNYLLKEVAAKIDDIYQAATEYRKVVRALPYYPIVLEGGGVVMLHEDKNEILDVKIYKSFNQYFGGDPAVDFGIPYVRIDSADSILKFIEEEMQMMDIDEKYADEHEDDDAE